MQKPHHHETLDAEMIHQAKLILGVRVPGSIDLHRAGRLAAIGIAQIRRDAAIFSAKLLHRVERRAVAEKVQCRVQSSARKD